MYIGIVSLHNNEKCIEARIISDETMVSSMRGGIHDGNTGGQQLTTTNLMFAILLRKRANGKGTSMCVSQQKK